jgi:hypothetical protein
MGNVVSLGWINYEVIVNSKQVHFLVHPDEKVSYRSIFLLYEIGKAGSTSLHAVSLGGRHRYRDLSSFP